MKLMNPKVDFYFEKPGKWQREIGKLRTIILGCELDEVLKWGCPCYTFQDANIVLIHVFKEYCALLFFKGALLDDPEGILVQQTENVQAARQIRFTHLREVTKLQSAVKAYIRAAIEVEKSGRKVELKKTAEFPVPGEFQEKLDGNPGLKRAFEALTPGRQRAYLLYFSAPKQSKTREARIEKCTDLILDGMGLND
jgi:uncharacterized protein YdeI (YjbR/CyaY-like superfamily)